jgi:nucleoporin GLE1
MATLREALNAEKYHSFAVDPSEFVLEARQQIEGSNLRNGPLPSLFLYLLNLFSKAVVSQFISESSADTRTADAIGQVVAKIFSEEEFQWRGSSLIDLLIAKYRVICPVLFGYKGNDKMEQGRARIGWKKNNGRWVSDQEHNDRMTGLGAGYASMTLRDFSRVKKQNPWPPSAYWTALAKIVNTPPPEISSTQCIVLKAMIADFEQKFIGFYGNAAVAALRYALIDFPARVVEPNAASRALQVQAKSLAVAGLHLD